MSVALLVAQVPLELLDEVVDRVGDAWEMSQGNVSIIDALLQQLSSS